jgi:hypothetical protein
VCTFGFYPAYLPVAAAQTSRTELAAHLRVAVLGDFTLPDAKDLRVTGSMTIGHEAGNLDTRGNISVSCCFLDAARLLKGSAWAVPHTSALVPIASS